MTFYPENKFKELNLLRQAQICLDLINYIDLHWLDIDTKNDLVKNLKNYFLWSNFSQSSDVGLINILKMSDLLNIQITQRRLFDFAVPLERYLNLSLKDDQFINITHIDGLNKVIKKLPIYLVLDHLRSSFNVGSIFRMAECLGVTHIFLVGYTPSPYDKGVKKTAMGTHEIVSWSHHHLLNDVIKELKEKNIYLVGLETLENAKSLSDFKCTQPIALFVGNERFGLSEKTIFELDECLTIPMLGQKNSMNVVNSLSIATHEVSKNYL
jgi:23S rRNA (guanosine2251-2'-O)-methyltransferase